LVVVAILLRKEIDANYNVTSCHACADLSRTNPNTFFEFSICNAKFTPEIVGHNLLAAAYRTPFSSPVPALLVWSLLISVVALLYSIRLWLNSESDDGVFTMSGVVSVYNVLASMLLLMVSGGFFQLYLKDGCYVSPWSENVLFTNFVANLTVLVPIILYVLYETACGRNAPYAVTATWFWLSIVSCLAFIGFTFILAIMNFRASGSFTQLGFISSVTVVCISEIVGFWRCFGAVPSEYQKVRAKEHITPEQKNNSFSENLA
jgi:hypothetical protein